MGSATRTDSLGRDTGHWNENYRCEHCGGHVIIRLHAAWPEQCPHCRVWLPLLTARAPSRPATPD